MKLIKISLIFLISTFSILADSTDNVGYGQDVFTRSRQVAEKIPALDFSVGTTAYSITLPRVSVSVYIKNDHATNTVYFNPTGTVPLNITGTTMYTTANSNIVDLNTPIAALDLDKGDLICLNEGDANDGIYAIMYFIEGTNKVVLDKNLTVTHSANQNYRLGSIVVKAGESYSFDVGTNQFSLVASGAATTVRIAVAYQQGA